MKWVKGKRLIILLVFVSAILSIWSAEFVFRNSLAQIVQVIAPRCSVGVAGLQASLTFVGLTASRVCDETIQNAGALCDELNQAQASQNRYSNAVTLDCSTFTLYRMSETPMQPEVCEGDWQGVHTIIRDQSPLPFVSYAMCAHLFSVPMPASP